MKQTTGDSSKTDVITASNSRAGHLASMKVRRKFWLEVHLWLGLTLGLFLSIFGITGSILVFHAEINELLNPQLLTVAVPDGNPVYKPLADIFQAGQAAMPQKAAHTFATYPRNDEAAFKLAYSSPLAGDVIESWEVYVNPYTAKVIGKRLMSSSDSPFQKPLLALFSNCITPCFWAKVLDISLSASWALY